MPISADKIIQLNAAYNYSPVLVLITGDLSTYTFTVDSGTNIFTATGHDFVNGTPVIFSSTGSLPNGIDSTETYFVINSSANTFKISATVGGSEVDVTSTGSGTNTVTEQPIIEHQNSYIDGSVVWDVLVRHEVSSYQGASRQSFAWNAAVQNLTTGRVTSAAVNVSVIPTTGNIDFRYFGILRGGNTTLGSSVGAIAILRDSTESTIGLQGVTFAIDAAFP